MTYEEILKIIDNQIKICESYIPLFKDEEADENNRRIEMLNMEKFAIEKFMKEQTPVNVNPSKDQSLKADAGKPEVRLVPSEIVRAIAYVRTFGVNKYHEEDSWKKVEVKRYIDALYRHVLLFIDNPTGVDEESGLPHLFHAACNVAFLCELMKGEWE